jgi:hypothetical protein
MVIHLDSAPANHLLWSGAGINQFINGTRPDPVSVFNDVYDVVDHFMDFHGSFGDQREMCEMIACYVMSTYMLDALPVTGYLWPNGEPGSGKSHLLQVIAVLGYLGQFILAGGSFASIRDLAGLGATLCFDDAEKIMDSRKGDPDKQALLLAGNRKGTTVTIKELAGDKKWMTKHINAYCPRCFSAIGLPNDTLSSRTIFIPLLASDNSHKASSDPLDFDNWPVNRQHLINDLWAVSLTHIRRLARHDKLVSESIGRSGRSLQPWRAILAVSMWLDAEGHAGLSDRMRGLLDAYGKEDGFGGYSHHALVLKALREILVDHPGGHDITFATKTLSSIITRIARANDLADESQEGAYINSRSLGWRLRRMRLRKPDGRNPNTREWIINDAELTRMETAAGIPQVQTSLTSKTSQTGKDVISRRPENGICDVSDNPDVSKEGYRPQVIDGGRA